MSVDIRTGCSFSERRDERVAKTPTNYQKEERQLPHRQKNEWLHSILLFPVLKTKITRNDKILSAIPSSGKTCFACIQIAVFLVAIITIHYRGSLYFPTSGNDVTAQSRHRLTSRYSRETTSADNAARLTTAVTKTNDYKRTRFDASISLGCSLPQDRDRPRADICHTTHKRQIWRPSVRPELWSWQDIRPCPVEVSWLSRSRPDYMDLCSAMSDTWSVRLFTPRSTPASSALNYGFARSCDTRPNRTSSTPWKSHKDHRLHNKKSPERINKELFKRTKKITRESTRPESKTRDLL